jgi:energy-coupling factor transporter transmembrane protein EcfT
MPTFGVTARAGALVLAIAAALVLQGPRLGVGLVCFWGLAGFLHPSAFRVLVRPAFWAVLLFLTAPTLAVGTPRDIALPLGLGVSSESVRLALTMIGRAAIIVVAASGFASRVSVRELTRLFEVAGLRGFGFSLGVAIHALPLAAHAWATSAQALRLRGGFRRARIRDLTLLATTVIGNALRHADEVVEAAQARGFVPERVRRVPPDRWRSDLVWIGAWGLGVALIVCA